jgi:cytoskeletal protein RodZ
VLCTLLVFVNFVTPGKVVASREATPMDLESAPGSPVLDKVAIQSPSEVTESETPPSVAAIAMDVEAALSTTTNPASAPAVVTIPRSVSRAANQAVVKPSSIASVPAPAIARTSPSPTALIGLPVQASTSPSASMAGTTGTSRVMHNRRRRLKWL